MTVEARKELALIIALVLVIVGSICWLASGFFRPKFNSKLHQGVGEALAAETATVLGGKGKVIVVIQDPLETPTLAVQLKAFQKRIGLSKGMSIQHTIVLHGAQQKLGPGLGLTADQFLAILEEHKGADAIVSFVGLPEPQHPKIAALGEFTGPRIIAETRNRGRLKPLFRNRLLQAAIVPRFQFPAPGSKNPSTPREWFDLSCQILRPGKLAAAE